MAWVLSSETIRFCGMYCHDAQWLKMIPLRTFVLRSYRNLDVYLGRGTKFLLSLMKKCESKTSKLNCQGTIKVWEMSAFFLSPFHSSQNKTYSSCQCKSTLSCCLFSSPACVNLTTKFSECDEN